MAIVIKQPKRQRFSVIRTVTNNTNRKQCGRSAEIELPATSASDAESQVVALFSHEADAVATYDVKPVRR